MSALQEYMLLRQQMDAKLEEFGEGMVVDLLRPIFLMSPKMLSVKWEQYTPYFNDGEPCVFSVAEPGIRFEGVAEDAGDYEDGYLDVYGVGPIVEGETTPYGNKYFEELEIEGALKGALLVKETFAGLPDDVLLKVFGDHAKVTINRDGTVENEEASHD